MIFFLDLIWLLAITNDAPFWKASLTYRFPSLLFPFIAKNTSFLFIVLELIDALFIFIFELIWTELLISFKMFILISVERSLFFNLIFFSISNLSEN